jgi:hypothetical protein
MEDGHVPARGIALVTAGFAIDDGLMPEMSKSRTSADPRRSWFTTPEARFRAHLRDRWRNRTLCPSDFLPRLKS